MEFFFLNIKTGQIPVLRSKTRSRTEGNAFHDLLRQSIQDQQTLEKSQFANGENTGDYTGLLPLLNMEGQMLTEWGWYNRHSHCCLRNLQIPSDLQSILVQWSSNPTDNQHHPFKWRDFWLHPRDGRPWHHYILKVVTGNLTFNFSWFNLYRHSAQISQLDVQLFLDCLFTKTFHEPQKFESACTLIKSHW